MSVVGIIGGQWGDEGKGKIVDLLSEKADMVIRFSGGPNAGHTVINSHGEFKLHLVPSSICNSHAISLISSGVVVSAEALLDEIDLLQRSHVAVSNMFVSERAHLIMPYHILLDKLEEESRGGSALGTTLRGVGPAYEDKVARRGIRVGDILDRDNLIHRLRIALDHNNTIITKVYGAAPLSLEDIYSQCCQYAERLAPFIRDIEPMVQEALDSDALILLEGAQGTLLDINFGTYPYVTSSSPIIGGACIGIGLGPTRIERVLGVFKSYITRVGSGPMPTELMDEVGDIIRERAHEYGATTGRPRRCGWFDAVAGHFSAQVNGFTGIVLTRLDVLDGFSSIRICTEYRLDDKRIRHFPSNSSVLERCEPIYEELPGWTGSVSHVRRFQDLPAEARTYVARLEELIGCPVDFISVGPRREESIVIRPLA